MWRKWGGVSFGPCLWDGTGFGPRGVVRRLGKCGLKKGENEMRKYKSNGELETVICNCCGKKLAVRDGLLREGSLEVEHAWDYFSEKDGEVHRFDLCEECYDEILRTFRIGVEVEEMKEFL